MGRRSRKRGATSRAERDAARRRPAPWGRFPLSELVIMAGIIVIFWGLFSGGDEGNERVGAGLVLASLGGGELALREHLGGYRSHSSLLAGMAGLVAVTVVVIGLGPVEMRELFKRRSGGLGFR